MPLIGDIGRRPAAPSRNFAVPSPHALSKGYLKSPRVSIESMKLSPHIRSRRGSQRRRISVSAPACACAIPLLLAGGFTYRASQGYVLIVRNGSRGEFKVPLKSNIEILPGDNIRVPGTIFSSPAHVSRRKKHETGMTTPRQHKRKRPRSTAPAVPCSPLAQRPASPCLLPVLAPATSPIPYPKTAAARDSLRTWDDAQAKTAPAHRQRSQPTRLSTGTGVRIGHLHGVANPYNKHHNSTIICTQQRANRESDLRIDIEPNIEFNANLPRHELKFGFGGRHVLDTWTTPSSTTKTPTAISLAPLHINARQPPIRQIRQRLHPLGSAVSPPTPNLSAN